jgi:hypothetical protein
MPALSPDSFPDCDAWRAIISESLLAFARANWMDAIDFDNWFASRRFGVQFRKVQRQVLAAVASDSAQFSERRITDVDTLRAPMRESAHGGGNRTA